MKLTEVHSSRIQSIIRKAIDHGLIHHSCRCPDCEKDHDPDEFDPKRITVNQDFDVHVVAQEILVALRKLETELVKV
jgi:hypothetical protein